MRRLSTVAGLVLVSLSFFPARADAVIWDWLDKLSGPSYKGFSVDWKVYCRASKTDAAGTYLLSLQRELTRDLEVYREQRDSSSPPARVYFEYAVRAATVASIFAPMGNSVSRP